MTPILCAVHQRRVVVGDRAVWHVHDGHPCDAPLLVRGSSVLTPAQLRAEDERSGAMDRTVATCPRCGGPDWPGAGCRCDDDGSGT